MLEIDAGIDDQTNACRARTCQNRIAIFIELSYIQMAMAIDQHQRLNPKPFTRNTSPEF